MHLAASLSWAGGEDVFGAGQKNVATLYEFWVFLELAKVLSSLCEQPLHLRELIAETTSGLGLVLQRDHPKVLKGWAVRKGREFEISLCFNQQFSPGPEGTWTKSLRPDCSLHIVPTDPGRKNDHVWLHFDAKYRV